MSTTTAYSLDSSELGPSPYGNNPVRLTDHRSTIEAMETVMADAGAKLYSMLLDSLHYIS